MSNQQPTAEKSVQTQELTGPTTVYVTNNPVTHLHTENTTAEVANTLVSMATGRQRGTAVKQLVNHHCHLSSYRFSFSFRMFTVYQQHNPLSRFLLYLIILQLEVYLQRWH